MNRKYLAMTPISRNNGSGGVALNYRTKLSEDIILKQQESKRDGSIRPKPDYRINNNWMTEHS